MKKLIFLKSMKVLMLISVLCLFCACPISDGQKTLTIVNKSDKDIAFQILFDYSDISFDCLGGTTTLLLIRTNSLIVKEVDDWTSGWEVLFNKYQTIDILIADETIYDQYRHEPCDTIRKYVPILHRYQLTLADLERMNWVVVYPPEE